MTVSRFDDVIGAIDLLIEDEQPAPVRFTPPTLSDREIEDFITATLARGEDGMGPATPAVVAPTVPVTPVRRAPRRRAYSATRPVEPRPNRYAGVCVDCDRLTPAGEGVLTRERGKWVVRHNECPTTAPAPRPTRRRRTPVAAVEPVEVADDSDCYVVTVEVEVVKDGIRSAREAALLALREVFTGEVAVTVTTPDNRTAEVNVTV